MSLPGTAMFMNLYTLFYNLFDRFYDGNPAEMLTKSGFTGVRVNNNDIIVGLDVDDPNLREDISMLRYLKGLFDGTK